MLEHFQAGDHVEGPFLCPEPFHRAAEVANFETPIEGVQAGHGEGALSGVHPRDLRAVARHGLGDQSAAASHVEKASPRKGRAVGNPLAAEGI